MARGPAQRTLTIYLIRKELAAEDRIIRPGVDPLPVNIRGRHTGDLSAGAPTQRSMVAAHRD